MTRCWLQLAMILGCCAPAWGQTPVEQSPPNPFAVEQFDDNPSEHEASCACSECHEYEWAEGGVEFAMPSLLSPADHVDFRHSSTDGRYFGKGQPLQGTSWLNRPYEVGLETGAFLMAGRVASHVRANNDLMAAIHVGWDWDHYWGTQLKAAWTTPAIGSGTAADPPDSSDIFIYDLSVLYYPWGDSKVRPYYRGGLGLTDLDYINSNDIAQDATLFTIPFGFGLKYQSQRWMAWRVELMDNLAFSQNGTRTLSNFSLTLGAEWRFGGKPAPRWYSPAANQVW